MVIQILLNDRLGNFILFINVRPFSIFFGKGDFDKAECLLKNWIIALPALLFNLCLVTNTIKSLYASFGNSVRASGSGSLASSKISDSSDSSDTSSTSDSSSSIFLHSSLLKFRIINCYMYFPYY